MNSCSYGVIKALPSQLGLSWFLSAVTKPLVSNQVLNTLTSQPQESHGLLVCKQMYSTHSQVYECNYECIGMCT
jgi:hypothetical protein